MPNPKPNEYLLFAVLCDRNDIWWIADLMTLSLSLTLAIVLSVREYRSVIFGIQTNDNDSLK